MTKKEYAKAWRLKNRDKIAKGHKKYYKSHPWARTFNNIKNRKRYKVIKSYKYYKNIEISITIDELRYLWFRDKAYNMNYPSIDRIDSNKGYALNNCRYLEYRENCRQARLGKGKIVKQLTLDRRLIKIWNTIMSVERKLNIDHACISHVCRGRQKTAGGYKWEYL